MRCRRVAHVNLHVSLGGVCTCLDSSSVHMCEHACGGHSPEGQRFTLGVVPLWISALCFKAGSSSSLFWLGRLATEL